MNKKLRLYVGCVLVLQVSVLIFALISASLKTERFYDLWPKALTFSIIDFLLLFFFVLLYRNPQACNFPRPPRDIRKAYEIIRTYILIIMSEMATLCLILSFLPFYPTWLLVMLVIGWTVVTIATMVKYIGRINRS